MENVLAYLTVQVHDPDGRRRFCRTWRSRSFTKNFLCMVGGFWSQSQGPGGGAWTCKDLTNTSRTAASSADSQANNANRRPQIGLGEGTTSPTVTDFNLETVIAGTPFTNVDSVTDDSSGDDIAYKFRIVFTNTSGGAWTVTEAALNVGPRFGGAANNFMIIRDTFGAINVNDGQSITVDYTVKTTV